MRWILSFMLMFSLWPLSVHAEPHSVKPGNPFIIINKASNKLAFIDDNEVKEILPVGTGKSQELTPEGIFTIKVKAVNPYYRKRISPAAIQGIHWGRGGLDLTQGTPMGGSMASMVRTNLPRLVNSFQTAVYACINPMWNVCTKK